MKKDDEMPTQHCRVGVQHRMSIKECTKMDAGADNTEEMPPDEDSDEASEG